MYILTASDLNAQVGSNTVLGVTGTKGEETIVDLELNL
jgi:hypothetical protein